MTLISSTSTLISSTSSLLGSSNLSSNSNLLGNSSALGSQTCPKFTSFLDVLNYLDELGLFHMDFSLNRINLALDKLNLRQLAFPVVQVVGTNGKGSTASFLASIAKAHGLRVGLYTSPHFLTVRERVRLNGQMLEAELWPALATKVYEAMPQLTYFEFITCLGLLAFKEAQVDLAIMEAGLGGHYDATTAIDAEVVAFSSISFDHEQVLGHTLAEIATDKAWAIRGKKVLTQSQAPEVLGILQAQAQVKGLALQLTTEASPEFQLGLAGVHQAANAGLAIAAWQALNLGVDWVKIQQGLQTAFIAGRLQRITTIPGFPEIILDGAHNVGGLQALRQSLQVLGLKPSVAIFSCLADKNLDLMLPLVKTLSDKLVVPTILDNERAMLSTDLALALGGIAVPRLSLALELVKTMDLPPDQPILICGSLYLLGEFFNLYPQALELV